jgi:hypothetical protein
MEPRELRPGDEVLVTPRTTGRVLRLIANMVEVEEFQILGRRAIWSLHRDVLMLVEK